MAAEIEALKGALSAQKEQAAAELASMAKLKSARVAREVCDASLQFWGGQGFMWESTVAQFYRDLRLHSIGGGADEVMLQIISKRLGLGGKRKSG